MCIFYWFLNDIYRENIEFLIRIHTYLQKYHQ